jgi:predicted dehydrogenase
MYEAVSRAPIRHCVAFNYRMAPAVLEAKRMIDDGLLGDLHHFRGCYLQDFAIDGAFPLVWRFKKKRAGSGALGDIGSHIIDFARYLCGEPRRVMAMLKTFIRERPEPDSDASTKGERGEVDVDDAVSMLIAFDHQAVGTIEASRFFNGRKNHLSFEISGSLGSLYFNWERNNELLFYSARQDRQAQGFKTIVVGPAQPYGGILWPIPGLGMAYLETTTVLLQRFLEGIAGKQNDNPDFYDGYKAAQVVEAVLTSAQRGEWAEIEKTESKKW